jgi:hypothetical protein
MSASTQDRRKTVCPVSREQFIDAAQDVEVSIAGVPMLAAVKLFSTGSLGWYLSGKTVIRVGDTPVSVQIGLNLTCVGSKSE